MQITGEEIEEAEKLSKKSGAVKKLLEFYREAQEDGERLLGISFNKMLIDTAQEYSGKRLSDISPEELSRTKMITEIFKNRHL